ncbi:hypothetical protein P7H71_04150 [Lactococcus lactis]|nr:MULTISPECIES: hypothetical protein [Lactococcus]MDT2879226.1 hypothetical protein [Lactococcus lactis]MDT2883023.1 hypothetical protein [Lactococcus lactis]MDT2899729.1 hypothetical protein [Lactococcus lactis]MDT2970396.1 hypothetical protein [Lactococcus lactis]WGV31113.1 hypothetical protein QJV49_03730 [Lactococcus sp. NH2-7C]
MSNKEQRRGRKKSFNSGDRVVRDISGPYAGMPGTIIGRSQVQYGYIHDVRYRIRLDESDIIIGEYSKNILYYDDETKQPIIK